MTQTVAPNDPSHGRLLHTAVSYVRVSTRGQATRARARDGYSIPAQREANKLRAHSLGALVVAEFIERGTSARSVDRPELQRMLTYVAEHEVDYVIVHKIDRLARNRADDARLTDRIHDAGARLVSTTEPISDSPDGRLQHGIMAAIAEFYAHNLSLEVSKVETARAEIQEQSHILSTRESTLRSLAAEAEQSPHAVYLGASPIIRQQLNPAVFTAIRIGRGAEQITYDLA